MDLGPYLAQGPAMNGYEMEEDQQTTASSCEMDDDVIDKHQDLAQATAITKGSEMEKDQQSTESPFHIDANLVLAAAENCNFHLRM